MFAWADLVLMLLQQTCVYLVIAYLFSKTPLFLPLIQVTVQPWRKVACWAVFSMFCIMGTYFGLHIGESIANTRAIGAVLGGILGGPLVGLAVGITGGLHRYSMGGFTALACAISTMSDGLIGGLVHSYLLRRHKIGLLLSPPLVAAVTLFAQLTQMAIIVAVARPFGDAVQLVAEIVLPMTVANTIGAAMFMSILLDRRKLFETHSAVFSAKALKIAARAEGVLRSGFDAENSTTVARILYEEAGVGAVAITDREKILAFIGIGADHHVPGRPITSAQTKEAIRDNKVMYADGNEVAYTCSIDPNCPLGAALVIPLQGEDGEVLGAIKLYEPKSKLFSTFNRALGEGVARLLSAQILAGRYERQKQLLAQSEIKLLHAQVNPHFLFNALNTLSAIIRIDPAEARRLVQNLSTFFRKNLKRASEEVTLEDEIEHVRAYLEIEKARFRDRLDVTLAIPPDLAAVHLPAFSLQPLVENAIKHGTSQVLGTGRIRLGARRDGEDLVVEVEDNAGLYEAKAPRSGGLGMTLVDRRLRARYGEAYGVSVACQPDVATRVSLRLPCATATVPESPVDAATAA
ncbi:sensor histidine kinase [Rhodoplanes sp. TEM]|uniref:histidine kinase n=1 Tax=Rhodoplanes tepidamans TaxID=200616 RepID=A0ABT5J6A1_RHOTP|nr:MULTISPECIES: sensor histidine kinase [Rhodoplanes]MDC7785173.1 sensor histidine kinase [Rhodoplanes tepidamans]MDC7987123.1 sensor histidine kinase [Rhodoplanes sp. TEM]MDQ0353430.1 two-component system LytT family sensor kinase [Rhodoplanes tepidamans]